MTIEPQHAVTLYIPPAKRGDDGRDPEEYRASIFSRFGRPPAGVPFFEWLARMENNARWARLAPSSPARLKEPNETAKPAPARYAAMGATFHMEWKAKTAANRQRMLDAIAYPMSVREIEEATSINRSQVTKYLKDAMAEGLVTKERVVRLSHVGSRPTPHTVSLWQRVNMEAAE